MSFQKRTEDFVCERCGKNVAGNGYTNHCPKCLWSKHVDVDPGDRAGKCGGLMRPIRTEGTVAAYFIIHECVRCGGKGRNIFGKEDSIEALLTIAKDAAEV
jgi:hypothetical protein